MVFNALYPPFFWYGLKQRLWRRSSQQPDTPMDPCNNLMMVGPELITPLSFKFEGMMAFRVSHDTEWNNFHTKGRNSTADDPPNPRAGTTRLCWEASGIGSLACLLSEWVGWLGGWVVPTVNLYGPTQRLLPHILHRSIYIYLACTETPKLS